MPEHDVIVVGAGLAGLAAARRLRRHDLEVVVVEARERVGGRLEHGRVDAHTVVELGGQWIGPTQHEMYTLVDELGLETFPTHTAGAGLLEVGGRHRRMDSRSLLPPIGRLAVADLAQGMLRFERLARQVPVDAPWEAPRARRLDSRTLESWLSTNLQTRNGRRFFRAAVEVVFACEASELSLLHALFYARSGTSLEHLLGVENAAQHERIVGGSARIAERMADALGEQVVLGCPVRRIEVGDGEVVVRSREGGVFSARRVIVALPPTLAGRLEYAPALAADRDQLTQQVPAGRVIKVYAVYDEPFWRGEGLNGQVISDRGPVKFVFDNSPPSGHPGVLMGFVEGHDAHLLGRRSLTQRREHVLAAFTHHFGPRAARPEQYLERDWAAEEFTRGCYGGHLAPGVWTSLGPQLREPCGRIHWAGAETAVRWNGYMDGAVSSGHRAADEVLAAS
jgi:monoamine oxidase